MPQTSNPISRDVALMSAEVSMPSRRRLPNKLPQHIRKNAAVAERDELLRRVDAHERREFDRLVALALRANDDDPAGTQALRDAGQVVALAAGEPVRCGRGAVLELQRAEDHVQEVAATDTLAAFLN